MGTVWRSKNVEALQRDSHCKHKEFSRSPILMDMKHIMESFYDSNEFYSHYNWIEEIQSIKGVNQWEISGDISEIERRNDLKLILVASRWMNGVCRYRCLKNIHELKQKIQI